MKVFIEETTCETNVNMTRKITLVNVYEINQEEYFDKTIKIIARTVNDNGDTESHTFGFSKNARIVIEGA